MSGRRTRALTEADRRTARAWERFVGGEAVTDGVRPQILLSWHRSRDDYAVDPGRERAPLADEAPAPAAAATVAAELGAAAMSVASAVEALGGVVAVGDGGGRILAAWGDPGAVTRGREQNLNPLFAWSERATGTTGIGMALHADGAVAVTRSEHWCAAFHDSTCAAVAVRDPADGRALGVIDVSVWNRPLPPRVLPWLERSAAAIEAHLARLTPPRRRRAAPAPDRLVGIRGRAQIVVAVPAVRTVEVDEGIVWLDTDDGRLRTRARTLSALETRLAGAGFARVSRERLVNLARVRELVPARSGGGWLVLDGGGVRVEVSRRRLPSLRRSLGL